MDNFEDFYYFPRYLYRLYSVINHIEKSMCSNPIIMLSQENSKKYQ